MKCDARPYEKEKGEITVNLLQRFERTGEGYVYFPKDASSRGPILDAILRVYPDITIITNFGNIAKDLVDESTSVITVPKVFGSRETLGPVKPLRDLLVKYHLEEILSRELFLEL